MVVGTWPCTRTLYGRDALQDHGLTKLGGSEVRSKVCNAHLGQAVLGLVPPGATSCPASRSIPFSILDVTRLSLCLQYAVSLIVALGQPAARQLKCIARASATRPSGLV